MAQITKKRNTTAKHTALRFVMSPRSIAILMSLNKIGKSSYVGLQRRIGLKVKSRAIRGDTVLAYYIRNLRKYGLISLDHEKNYSINDKGKRVLKLFSLFDEKFITEDMDNKDFCQNSFNDSFDHEFVYYCRNCSYIKPLNKDD